jgi:Trk K+ transport system NAD-binding subunit
MAVTMVQPYWYEIRVEGHLAEQWSDWFDGLAIQIDSSDETTLSGWIADQAALFGVLTRIHNLNLILISVCRSLPK